MCIGINLRCNSNNRCIKFLRLLNERLSALFRGICCVLISSIFCIVFLSFAKFIAKYHILPVLFYVNVPNMFTRDLSKHQFVPKNHYNKKSLYLTPNYFYIIIHSPFRFTFFSSNKSFPLHFIHSCFNCS